MHDIAIMQINEGQQEWVNDLPYSVCLGHLPPALLNISEYIALARKLADQVNAILILKCSPLQLNNTQPLNIW